MLLKRFNLKALCAAVVLLVCFISGISFADTFAKGTANEFTIDFVPISGDSGDLGSWPADSGYTFSGVNHGDYRMGKYEITNDQFAKFAANNPYWTGADVPSNNVSWFEAAQFVNYLNTSTGNPAAYKFNGSTFSAWAPGDTGYDVSNPYRNRNAYYFLPTEDEWVKAAYWNGTSLQIFATSEHTYPLEDVDANYGDEPGAQPWNVGSGSMELNGTYDMMGNVWEWMESPYYSGDYLSDSSRGIRGGCYAHVGGGAYFLRSYCRIAASYPHREFYTQGFRVASVPEPCSFVLLGLGGLAVLRRKRR